MNAVVGYVLESYPKLSETFIVNELLGLEERGLQTKVFALGAASDAVFNPDVARVRAEIRYLAGLNESRLVESITTAKNLAGAAGEGFDKAVAFSRHLAPSRRGWRLLQAIDLVQLAVQAGVTHFHAHFLSEAAAVAYMAHLMTGVPFTVTAHAKEIYRRPLNLPKIREIYQACRALVTVCDANKRYLCETILDRDGSKVFRIYNGLPMGDFQPNGAVQRDGRSILGVGRLSIKKGWHVLLAACSELRKDSVDFRCVIVGAGSERPRLLELRTELGLEAHVELPGAMRRTDILNLMRSASVLAAPCLTASDGNQDALPTVLLEALALGLPVVSTHVGGIPEIVDDGKEGLLVPENDHHALASAIGRILSDKDLGTRLSSEGPRKIESKFNQRTTIPALLRLFEPNPQIPI